MRQVCPDIQSSVLSALSFCVTNAFNCPLIRFQFQFPFPFQFQFDSSFVQLFNTLFYFFGGLFTACCVIFLWSSNHCHSLILQFFSFLFPFNCSINQWALLLICTPRAMGYPPFPPLTSVVVQPSLNFHSSLWLPSGNLSVGNILELATRRRRWLQFDQAAEISDSRKTNTEKLTLTVLQFHS